MIASQATILRLLTASFILLAAKLQALNVVIDYSHDIADGGDFFGNNAVAKAALEQAAADVSNAITTTLGAITSDPVNATNGSTNYSINARFSYTNPVTDLAESLSDTRMAQDEFRIYVGTQNLSGSSLGEGGPGGNGFSASGGGFESEWIQAVANAESTFNSQYTRGGGPLVSSFTNRSTTLGSTTANYDVNFGASIGNLWFDVDSDNDGFTDDSATLSNYWHFDHTTNVESGKNDFYSVALHEILHALGIGTIDSWDDLVNGLDWEGAVAIAENGTGVGLLHTDQAHIAEGVMSTTIVGNMAQEAALDPSITTGTRKSLTALDLAFMQDIGWSVVPEPSIYATITAGFAFLALFFRRRDLS